MKNIIEGINLGGMVASFVLGVIMAPQPGYGRGYSDGVKDERIKNLRQK